MTKQEALALVYRALENLNAELDAPIEVAGHTKLFGAEAVIDSLSLVSVIVDVETEASETLGFAVSLTDDRAINQPVSPFTDPDALADYLVLVASERS
jgi:acyl carrier protein